MHNLRLTNIIIGFLYIAVVLWFSSILLGYNSIYIKILVIGLAIIPFAFTNIIKSREYWLVIGLGATIFISKIPLPLFDAISIGYTVNAIILLLMFAELAMKKLSLPKIFETFPNRCMALFMLIVTARFIYDRPGAGSMGGTGGLSAALPTILAGWCFFSTYVLAKQFEVNKKQLKILKIIVGIGLIDVIYRNVTIFIPNGFVNIFPYPAVWFLSFLGLTKIINEHSDEKNFKKEVKMVIVTSIIMVVSFISINRAPVLYATVGLFAVYWCYKFLNKYFIMFFIGIIIVVTTAALYPAIIPKPAMRTMSLFTGELDKSKTAELGETGWMSNWRATLARIAWEDIKRHPIAGKGFAFAFEDLFFNARLASTGDEARFGGLLLSGGYHNSFLFLAVKVGIPATIAYILAMINIFYRFLLFSRKLTNSELKQLCVTLAAVFVCIYGKMITNGGPLDLFAMSITMATMQGIRINNKQTTNSTE